MSRIGNETGVGPAIYPGQQKEAPRPPRPHGRGRTTPRFTSHRGTETTPVTTTEEPEESPTALAKPNPWEITPVTGIHQVSELAKQTTSIEEANRFLARAEERCASGSASERAACPEAVRIWQRRLAELKTQAKITAEPVPEKIEDWEIIKTTPGTTIASLNTIERDPSEAVALGSTDPVMDDDSRRELHEDLEAAAGWPETNPNGQEDVNGGGTIVEAENDGHTEISDPGRFRGDTVVAPAPEGPYDEIPLFRESNRQPEKPTPAAIGLAGETGAAIPAEQDIDQRDAEAQRLLDEEDAAREAATFPNGREVTPPHRDNLPPLPMTPEPPNLAETVQISNSDDATQVLTPWLDRLQDDPSANPEEWSRPDTSPTPSKNPLEIQWLESVKNMVATSSETRARKSLEELRAARDAELLKVNLGRGESRVVDQDLRPELRHLRRGLRKIDLEIEAWENQFPQLREHPVVVAETAPVKQKKVGWFDRLLGSDKKAKRVSRNGSPEKTDNLETAKRAISTEVEEEANAAEAPTTIGPAPEAKTENIPIAETKTPSFPDLPAESVRELGDEVITVVEPSPEPPPGPSSETPPETPKPPSRSGLGRWARRTLVALGLMSPGLLVPHSLDKETPNLPISEILKKVMDGSAPEIEIPNRVNPEALRIGTVGTDGEHNRITALIKNVLEYYGISKEHSLGLAVQLTEQQNLSDIGLRGEAVGHLSLGIAPDADNRYHITFLDPQTGDELENPTTYLYDLKTGSKTSDLALDRDNIEWLRTAAESQPVAPLGARELLVSQLKTEAATSAANTPIDSETARTTATIPQSEIVSPVAAEVPEPVVYLADQRAVEIALTDLNFGKGLAYTDSAVSLQKEIAEKIPNPSVQLAAAFETYVADIRLIKDAVDSHDSEALKSLQETAKQDLATLVNNVRIEEKFPNLMTKQNMLNSRISQLGNNISEKIKRRYAEAVAAKALLDAAINAGNKYSLNQLEKKAKKADKAITAALEVANAG